MSLSAIRRSVSSRVSWLSLVGLVLVPLVVAGGFAIAAFNADGRLSQVKAAIVNDDRTVVVDGDEVNLGTELTDGLLNTKESNFSWEVVDSPKEAADGLSKGDYAATIAIPESFSADATSFSKPDTASAAQIDVKTSEVGPLTDSIVGQAIAKTATGKLNKGVTEKYLNKLYLGFGDLRDGLRQGTDAAGQIQDGSQQLSTGLGTAKEGSGQLRDGLGQLTAKNGELRDGTGQLADGAGKAAKGADTLSAGAHKLSGGAGKLSDGLGTMKDKTKDMPAQVNKLNDGAGQVADGAGELGKGANTLGDGLGKIDDGAGKLEDGTRQVDDGAGKLADGSEQLDDGIGQLQGKSKELKKGIDEYTGGVDKFRETFAAVPGREAKLDQLKGGTKQLVDGSGKLSDGADQLAGGGKDLEKGIGKASDELGSNAKLLRSAVGLGKLGLSQIPKEQRQQFCGAYNYPIDSDECLIVMKGVIGGLTAAKDGLDNTKNEQGLTLKQGAHAISTGASDLSDGADQLQGGAKKVDDGVGQLRDGMKLFVEPTGPLAKGGEQLRDAGNQAVDGSNELRDGSKQVRDGAGTLAENTPALAKGAKELHTATGQASDGARKLSDGGTKLADGAKQVHGGTDKLAKAVPALKDGLGQAADGSNQLRDGAGKLSDGASTLADGNRTLADGATKLDDGVTRYTDGVAQAETGSTQLNDGIARLVDGSTKLTDGTDQLHEALGKGADQAPHYTAPQREKMKSVAAEPVTAPASTSLVSNIAAIALIVVLSLWIGGLATYLVVHPVAPELVHSRMSTLRVYLRAITPGIIVAVVQGLIMSVVGILAWKLNVGDSVTLLVFAILAAMMFAAVNHALVSLLGGFGRVISVLFVVLAVAAKLMPAMPPALEALSPLVPLTPVFNGLTALASGGSGYTAAFFGVLIWMAVGVLASFAGILLKRRGLLARRHVIQPEPNVY